MTKRAPIKAYLVLEVPLGKRVKVRILSEHRTKEEGLQALDRAAARSPYSCVLVHLSASMMASRQKNVTKVKKRSSQ